MEMQHDGDVTNVAGDLLTLLRWSIKMTLGIICLGIIRGFLLMGGKPDWFLLGFLTPAAFIIITPILIISGLLEETLQPPLLELIFDWLGTILYITSAGCSLSYYSTFLTAPQFRHAGYVYGVMALFAGICYAIGSFLPHKDRFPTVAGVRAFARKNLRV